jgi:hypothetical protein
MARNTHSYAITSELVSMKINMRDGGYSRLRVVNRSMNQPAWTLSATRDGSKLVALNGRITSSVFVADLIDEGRQMTNARRFTMDNYISRPGAWLADNRTLVYYSNRGGHFNLFSRNIDDADARSMVQDDEEKYWPTITADQQWMFYFIDLAKQHGSDTELALVRYSMVDGKTKVIDTKPDAYRSLRCAISTNRCVIMEHTGNEGIYYEFDPLIGRGKQLAKTRWTPVKSYSYWDLSPDGSQIGFIDSVNDPMGIGIIAINENPVKVFMLHVNDTNPLRTLRWDAQGKGFYVSSFDSAGDLLKLLHVELNGNVQLLRWQVGSNDGRAIPSPDGKRLAFQQNMLNSNIWMLQREFEQ